MKKEIVSVTAIDERDMTRSVIARADEAISELEGRLSEANQRMQNAVQELKSIPEDRQRRIAEYGKAKEERARLKDKLLEATALAKLYNDTPLARTRWDEQEQLLTECEQAESVLKQTEDEVNTRGFSSKAREQELQHLIDSLTPLIVSLQTELKHMQSAREQAFQELGRQEHAAIIEEYHAMQARASELKAMQIEAEQELLTWSAEKLRTFTQWPQLRQQLREQLPQEDSHTRVLASYIGYLESFMADRQGLARKLPIPAYPGQSYGSHLDNWSELLTFTPSEWFYGDFRHPNPPRVITSRLEKLRQVLADYRTYLAENT